MPNEPVSATHGPYGNGKRWYDPSRMVTALFSVLAFFLIAWGGFVFTVAYGASQKNLEQDGQIKAITERLSGFDLKLDKQDGKLDKQDAKLDRVLERMPK